MALHERLQHRKDEDLPPLPTALERGTPGSVLAPVAVQPVEVIAAPEPTPREQLKKVVEQVRKERGELAPSTSTFPGLADWKPDRRMEWL